MGDPPGIIYPDRYGSGEIPPPATRYENTRGVILLSWDGSGESIPDDDLPIAILSPDRRPATARAKRGVVIHIRTTRQRNGDESNGKRSASVAANAAIPWCFLTQDPCMLGSGDSYERNYSRIKQRLLAPSRHTWLIPSYQARNVARGPWRKKLAQTIRQYRDIYRHALSTMV
jgi:hypothetical protein